MHNYLSHGMGINSVALQLYLIENEWDYTAVFADHGTDWPETYEYLGYLQNWLTKNGHPIIKVIKPKIGNLYDYCHDHRMVPATWPRWCTVRAKLKVLFEFYERPCFQLIGIDAGESHRAFISSEKGIENRYPLIEAQLNRVLCERLIKRHGLKLPHKSGCYICPFQTIAEWKELRRLHPDLFCKALSLEQRNGEYRISKGKKPMYLYGNAKPLRVVVDENQEQLFSRDEYPPCICAV